MLLLPYQSKEAKRACKVASGRATRTVGLLRDPLAKRIEMPLDWTKSPPAKVPNELDDYLDERGKIHTD
jgi:hypothetical protein